MPPLREPSPMQNTDPMMISALLFDRMSPDPLRVQVPTVIPIGESLYRPRYPCVESVIGSGFRIHDCVVAVDDHRGRKVRFLISCHYTLGFPVNQALERVRAGTLWRGSLVVMRQGSNVFVTDMGGVSNQNLARIAVARFLEAHIEAATNSEGRDIPRSIPDN
ncbi:hypothetical protein BV25DRAFT_1921582 [Artomyces pyxidatus]|uniref:Uncharacterized protein n=2 Tax=Artomyces pyxidatus TaxID=48021 RepID=A0ACB8SG97_9AGAM|nr:hypothetical protein BV25DRAFT_1922366 [Artomyces pyxidatus]KAI0055731.1 hypothetical protein BV25DRAFT_1921582 [Artomyces pyxidatus]